MKSLDFIKEAKTNAIGFRKTIENGQDVWKIIRPDGKIDTVPRGFLEQLPRDVEFVAWNTAVLCPPGFSCSPQANGQPAPKVGEVPKEPVPVPQVSVSGTNPPPTPMSTAHIDIAAKRQGAPSSQQTATRSAPGSSVPSSTRPTKQYAGSKGAQAIQQLNPGIKDINKIYVGQELVMPDGGRYRVQSGDTLDKIAAKQNRRPVELEMTQPYRDFADIKKDSSKLLAESSDLSPVEKIQHLRSLLEAPAPNPPRAEPSLNPSVPAEKPVVEPQVWRGRGPPPLSAEDQIKNKWLQDTTELRNKLNSGQINLNTYNTELAKLDKAAETAIKNIRSSATPGSTTTSAQGNISQGIKAASGRSFPGKQKQGAKTTASPAASPVQHDPEHVSQINRQRAATGQTNPSMPNLPGLRGKIISGLKYLATAVVGGYVTKKLTDPDPIGSVWGDIKGFYNWVTTQTVPSPEQDPKKASDEANKQRAIEIFMQDVGPYLKYTETEFSNLSKDDKEFILTRTEQIIKILQDPSKYKDMPAIPPHFKRPSPATSIPYPQPQTSKTP